jgi:hypothetical protein
MSNRANRRLTRRQALRLAGVGTVAALAAACVPTTPQVLKETVIVAGTPESL